jgi:hypothetical protein
VLTAPRAKLVRVAVDLSASKSAKALSGWAQQSF